MPPVLPNRDDDHDEDGPPRRTKKRSASRAEVAAGGDAVGRTQAEGRASSSSSTTTNTGDATIPAAGKEERRDEDGRDSGRRGEGEAGSDDGRRDDDRHHPQGAVLEANTAFFRGKVKARKLGGRKTTRGVVGTTNGNKNGVTFYEGGDAVTVDEHGLIVIEPSSLLPNPESRRSTSQIDDELGNAVIDEGENAGRLGAIQARYDSYTTNARTTPARWTPRETRTFFDALRQCGPDFGLMQTFCPGRTRMQLKRKFKVESRKNARLVDMALDPKCKVKLDLSVFGDDLEIPEEVPPFAAGATPADPAAPGCASSASTAKERGEETDRGDAASSVRTRDSRSKALQSLRNFTDF
ncbi:hypothetical protein ACHAW5_005430 [Stephanodiscus triporus]|uniref:Myb-like domain-containing protein n=1 Tax=Stephanodiscus triporus TaxID=2934178 RepID=A0ABD3P214_9STRA